MYRRKRYGRRRFKKRSYAKRGGRFSKGRGACLTGRKPESKYVDITSHDLDVDAVGTAGTNFALLSTIPQGVTAITRVGRRATITSVHLQGQYLPPVTATSLADLDNYFQRIKLWVVHDTQANGAIFTAATFLASADINSYRNLNNSSRFKVLATRQIVSNPDSVSGDGASATKLCRSAHPWKVDIKCCIPIDFNSTAGVITEQKLSSIYLFAMAENSDASAIGALTFFSRIRFTDS